MLFRVARTASGAGSTAPGLEAEASGSQYPGCSAPAGQNHAWCSPSDFWAKDFMRKDIAEINSDEYDIFLQENLSMIK